jgi:Fe-Mn family superoxide dismutase
MQLALEASFGSAARWRDAFVAMARARGGEPGRVLLAFEPHEGRLRHHWAADDAPAPADAVPILALAAHDAAAQADPGALVDRIDWATVYRRYQQAVHAASEGFGADEPGDALVLDVRRAGVFAQARAMIPGARWCDPAAVGDWSAELPTDRDLVVYCVYGHEVGRATALRLRAAGLRARYLRGGIDGWQAAGRPLVDKPVPATP